MWPQHMPIDGDIVPYYYRGKGYHLKRFVRVFWKQSGSGRLSMLLTEPNNATRHTTAAQVADCVGIAKREHYYRVSTVHVSYVRRRKIGNINCSMSVH